MQIIDGSETRYYTNWTNVRGREGYWLGGAGRKRRLGRRWKTAEASIGGQGEEGGTAGLPRAGRPHAREGQRWHAPLGRSQYPG